ncbi:hypothetical protein COOONC_14144 [Cooperia oncophora]
MSSLLKTINCHVMSVIRRKDGLIKSAADGNAVQELLPAVKLLYEAAKQLPTEDVNAHWNAIKTKLNAKIQEIRIARQLSTQLPQTGAALHDLIGKELYCRVSGVLCTSKFALVLSNVFTCFIMIKLRVASLETPAEDTLGLQVSLRFH